MKVKAQNKRFQLYPIIVFILIGLTIWASYSWGTANNLFVVKNVLVSTNTEQSDSRYSQKVAHLTNSSLWNIDVEYIEGIYKEEPFIDAVRVSKQFPGTIQIDLNERKPIAILNSYPFVCVDRNAVFLPAKENIFDLPIPILTNFIHDDKTIEFGHKTNSELLESAIAVLSLMTSEYPALYANLSEFRLTNENEFELILQDQPTHIYLGKNNIRNKLLILSEFEELVQGTKQLTDYLYLDLRYANQIITRERRA
jgi:cell division protein FtsQ